MKVVSSKDILVDYLSVVTQIHDDDDDDEDCFSSLAGVGGFGRENALLASVR